MGNFKVYKSSAGSGKTYTLVKEYLALLMKDPGCYRNILAITFTNKAANEMKSRILDNLRDIAKENKNSSAYRYLLPELIKVTGMPEERIIQNASLAFSSILHNYSDFSVSTIDSFVHKIIRRFAFDLRLPGQFDVVIEENEVLEQVVDLLISKAGTDEELTRTLIEFSESKAEEEKNWHIEGDIFDLSKNLLKESSSDYSEKLSHLHLRDFEKIRQHIWSEMTDFKKMIKSKGREASELIRSRRLPDSAFYQGRSGIPAYFRKLEACETIDLMPKANPIKTVDEDKWYGGNATTEEKIAIDEIKADLAEIFRSALGFLKAKLGDYKLLNLIYRNIYTIALLNEIKKVISDLKRENNILLISDFNRKIAEVVQKEPVPYIYERAGERYLHYLVDEFQDTSVLQWHNLVPLIEESLSRSDRCTNLVVGDGKQAIYRFRNGEVEQFSCLPAIFMKEASPAVAEKEAILVRNHEEIILDYNFRSLEEIVGFNNSFFSVIAAYPGFAWRDIYRDCIQQSVPGKKGGYIQIDLFERIKGQTVLYENNNLFRIKEIIEELLSENYQPADIAVLCRDNRRAAKIASFLITNNFDIVSAESLLLKNSAVVNFILSTLLYLNDDKNQVSVAGMVSFLCGRPGQFQEEKFHTVMKTVLSQEGGLQRYLANKGFGFNPVFLRSLPLFEICEEVVNIFRLNSEPDTYLQFFLDAVLDAVIKKSLTLVDVADWWEEKKDSLSVISPGNLNAVRVMTIHKAKGLEFPVVIYPFADEDLDNTNPSLWTDLNFPGLENLPAVVVPVSENAMEGTVFENLYVKERDKSFLDMVNVVYVAMTRPVERLYVLAKYVNKKEDTIKSVPDMFWYYLKKQGLFQEGIFSYSFGTREAKKEKATADMQKIILTEMYSSGWRKRMKLHATTSPLSGMDPAAGGKAWGNLMHYALSMIRTADDLPSVTERLVMEGYVAESEKHILQNKIKKIINHPVAQDFFSGENTVFTEAEIATSGGNFFRPDRVIVKGNDTIVVDYKTGLKDRKHHMQLEHYKILLQEMGYRNITAYLLYLSDEIELIMV